MIAHVNEIKINDIFLLSGYFEIAKIIFELIYNEQSNKKASSRVKK